MKLLQTFAVVFLFTISYACLKLDAKYNWDTRDIGGTLTDNGNNICTFSGKLHEAHHFGSCIAGFSAFIDGSLNWGSYSNHGNEGTFPVVKETNHKGLNKHEFALVARAFGC